jgi:hypothetical protein
LRSRRHVSKRHVRNPDAFFKPVRKPKHIGCAGRSAIAIRRRFPMRFSTCQGGRYSGGPPKLAVLDGSDMSTSGPLQWQRLKKQRKEGITKNHSHRST